MTKPEKHQAPSSEEAANKEVANKEIPDEEVSDKAADQVARIGDGGVVLSTRGLSYWYGQVIGINDISLDIGHGVVGLLGPNGAGKSTLLKCMTGQLRPATGMVSIDGKRVWDNPDVYSEIGFVPEQDAFYEEMTGREFVTHLTRLHGFGADDAAKLADEAIETVSLTEEADRPIAGYSKGMRQRIKIAQSLAHRPRVLFFDEPLAGTDPVGRRKMIDLIRRLGDEARTVIVSSHVLHEVQAMTSNIVLINRGRVVADGNMYRIREMIDEFPHRIYIDCKKPRPFAALLAEYDDVRSLEFADRGFFVSTDDPQACYDRIPAMALEHDLGLRAMTSEDNDLSAVFRYLVP